MLDSSMTVVIHLVDVGARYKGGGRGLTLHKERQCKQRAQRSAMREDNGGGQWGEGEKAEEEQQVKGASIRRRKSQDTLPGPWMR